MTGKEICEAWMQRCYPTLPQKEIERLALELWNLSPSGDISHIFAIAELLAVPDAERWLVRVWIEGPIWASHCMPKAKALAHGEHWNRTNGPFWWRLWCRIVGTKIKAEPPQKEGKTP